jgi:hypothetical protein
VFTTNPRKPVFLSPTFVCFNNESNDTNPLPRAFPAPVPCAITGTTSHANNAKHTNTAPFDIARTNLLITGCFISSSPNWLRWLLLPAPELSTTRELNTLKKHVRDKKSINFDTIYAPLFSSSTP